MYYSQ